MRRLLLKVVPRRAAVALRCLKILENCYGHARSVREQASVDARGDPMPWYTYPAIEYIKQLDFSERCVFEYGSGNSSLFWQRVAKRVIAVENNAEWYNKVAPRLAANASVVLASDRDSYVNELFRHNCEFDVIVVDGAYRFECARAAVTKLKRGGVIILDNADWWAKTTRFLRDEGLIEVDMAGFGPINAYTWVTSFFFDRGFGFGRVAAVSPSKVIGGLEKQADD